ncbi:MAG: carbon-nitrogen hydrolase family protein [Phycisphaeraceae bacterium]|nr:carbon-nitrogen hydrolase family protein [Phycisphaeraceae bacterium]
MMERILAAIALSNRDYSSLEEKLIEACQWIEFAGRQHADLVVLPENLGQYYGDGPRHPHPQSFAETVLENWSEAAARLIETARQAQLALVVPVITTVEGKLRNCFFVISNEGNLLGRYDKMFPTPEELAMGIIPGANDQPLIEWQGLRIGGGICFDTCFSDVLLQQAGRGANLFLIPSLWPGGTALHEVARVNSTPIILAYPAWSQIIDATGRTVAATGYRHETLGFGFGSPLCIAPINFDHVALFANLNQNKIVDVQRKYGQNLRIFFDQPNCTFHIESRSPSVTVGQIVKEFELVPFSDYFESCRRCRDSALV